MFTRFLEWVRKVIKTLIGSSTLKSALNVDVTVSAPMAEALQQWSDMYLNKASWLSKDVISLNLPATISGEIARVVTVEMKAEITGSVRADWLNKQIGLIIPKLRRQVEYGVAKGGLILKPYVSGSEIVVDYVQADCFYPVAFDAQGNITSCIFSDQKTIGSDYYTRLEFHELSGTNYNIRNLAFKSSVKAELGRQVPLSLVPEWATLEEAATITDVETPLFAYFKYPLANNIDPTSPLGVSCFSRAVDQIKQADIQWSNLLWEFESGQRALYADIVAFQRKDDGTPILPIKRLYRALGGSSAIGTEELFKEWSPTLREANILNGLDAILRQIEFECGLAYGILSNPQSVDKTATEIKISRQRTYSTITDTQKALEQALDQLLYAMDVWANLYSLAPRGSYTAVFEFDDSVVVDKDAQFQQDLRLVTSGIMSKVEFRMRNFGETEEAAREKIALVSEGMEPLFPEEGGATNPFKKRTPVAAQ